MIRTIIACALHPTKDHSVAKIWPRGRNLKTRGSSSGRLVRARLRASDPSRVHSRDFERGISDKPENESFPWHLREVLVILVLQSKLVSPTAPKVGLQHSCYIPFYFSFLAEPLERDFSFRRLVQHIPRAVISTRSQQNCEPTRMKICPKIDSRTLFGVCAFCAP